MASIPSPIRKWIRRYITGEGSNEIANQSPVQSVNSQTGDVTISTGGGSIPPSQTVTSYSDLPTTDLSEAEIWLVAGEEDVVVSTQLSPVVWRSVSDFTKVASQIPDSAIHRRNAGKTSESDGQTVDPWSDLIGSDDLVATGDPTLAAGSVNNQDAVNLDGADDGYDYASNLGSAVTEPCTIIWGLRIDSLPSSGISALLSDDNTDGINDVLLRTDTGEIQCRLGFDEFSNPNSPTVGDKVFTLTVSATNGASFRRNGVEIASLGSASIATDETVLTTNSSGSFYAGLGNSRRYLDASAVEDVVHNTELTGSELTDEEKRVESEANMSVL